MPRYPAASTLILAVVATVIGCIIGLVCGILNTIPYTKRDPIIKRFFLKLIRVVVRIYVEVFRGTPMVLQAVFIYYGLPFFTNEQVMFRGNGGLWLAAIIVVSINTGAYMAETVRGGIISIDPGQTEGAKAIGMTHVQTMTSVILPQAIRNILPQIGNNFIINIKDTSVMFIIGFRGVLRRPPLHRGQQQHVLPLRRHRDDRLPHHDADRLLPAALGGAAHGRRKRDYELVQADALTMTAGTYTHPDKGHPLRTAHQRAPRACRNKSSGSRPSQDPNMAETEGSAEHERKQNS